MSGRSSRQKGAAAEREVVALLREVGYDVHRTPHSGALEWLKGDVCGFPGCHIEVKRHEALRIPEWCAKVEAEAKDKLALLIFRRSREPWRVVLRLEDFLKLMKA